MQESRLRVSDFKSVVLGNMKEKLRLPPAMTDLLKKTRREWGGR